jgi:hypothetical protein
MDLKQMGYENADWVCLGEDRGQWRDLVIIAMDVVTP